jgi:crotonobetainyl-CoA:carnitine CoA-transferase CaiB-like acyl-CoA transferase
MPGYGLTGPYSEYPAFGSTAESISGINSMIGYDIDEPLQTGLSYADPISGLNSVSLVMAMLRKRMLTGQGSYVELALADSPIGTLGEFFVAASAGTGNTSIMSNKREYLSPHGVYRTRGEDKWIALAVETDEEWSRLVSMIGDERLKSPFFKHTADRKRREELIDYYISDWAIRMERDDAMKLLQANHISAGAVLNNLELLENEHLNDRNFFTFLTEKVYGDQKYDGQSIPGHKKSPNGWFPMKEIGESTDEILNCLLGKKYNETENYYQQNRTFVNNEKST